MQEAKRTTRRKPPCAAIGTSPYSRASAGFAQFARSPFAVTQRTRPPRSEPQFAGPRDHRLASAGRPHRKPIAGAQVQGPEDRMHHGRAEPLEGLPARCQGQPEPGGLVEGVTKRRIAAASHSPHLFQIEGGDCGFPQAQVEVERTPTFRGARAEAVALFRWQSRSPRRNRLHVLFRFGER